MAKKCPKVDNWCRSELETFKTTFLWTITNFKQSPEKTGELLKSSTFNANGDVNTQWYIGIYPNGEKEECKDFISVFLYLKESIGTQVYATVKMSIIDIDRNRCEEKELKHHFQKNRGFGWNQFVKKSKFEDSSSKLLPEDDLTIFCEVITSFKRQLTDGKMFGSNKKLKTLSDDMTEHYQTLSDSDIQIVVNGHKFSAHKVILKTRSPVFSAMLEHPMKESNQNKIVIEDIDEKVFAKVLKFMYTDQVDNEDIQTSSFSLLYAADKYNLDSLKHICVEYISSQLCVDTVSNVLIFSDLLNLEELKLAAVDFIKTNRNKVMKTKGWKYVIDKSNLLDIF